MESLRLKNTVVEIQNSVAIFCNEHEMWKHFVGGEIGQRKIHTLTKGETKRYNAIKYIKRHMGYNEKVT